MASNYTFRLAPGFRFKRRGIGFLEGEGGKLDAGKVFDGLAGKKDFVRSIMDHWIAGNDRPAWWFHGWNFDPYKKCFVFKWDQKEGRSKKAVRFLDSSNTENYPRLRIVWSSFPRYEK